ncbi:MAG: hypothetical protein ACYTG1_01365 [Planctomycetota bacterium]|jgi:hypothetical protein
MRQQKYLNVILTVNAVLLAGLLWTQLAETPILARTADAQVRSVPYQRDVTRPGTVLNAGKQRAETNQSLREIKQELADISQRLSSGDLEVRVSNLDEIRIEVNQ